MLNKRGFTVKDRMEEYNIYVLPIYRYKSVANFRAFLNQNWKKGEMPLLGIAKHKTKAGKRLLFNFPDTIGL